MAESQSLPDVTITSTQIPASYHWPKQELNHTPHDSYSDLEVPVIDLQDPSRATLLQACTHWGFFQVVNHGVSPDLLSRAHSAAASFFNLPLERKEALECKPHGDRFLGYGFPMATNRARETRRYWSEGLFLDSPHVAEYSAALGSSDAAGEFRNAIESSEAGEFRDAIESEEAGAFRDAIEEYLGAMRVLGVRLFRLILESLGVVVGVGDGEERFVPKEPGLMRLNHYPPCPDPGATAGLLPHHDANLITILYQGDVAGLQVLNEGRWVAVRPVPGAFSVNAGNMLQAISNDMCTSALHRAVVNKDKDRYSLAYFVQAPDWDQITPLSELVDDNHPAKYRPFSWPEYLVSQIANPANALEHFAVQ